MAELGKLVEARFPPPSRSETPDEVAIPADLELLSVSSGPPKPLVIAIGHDGRSTWIGGDLGQVRFPWGPVDSINDHGAYTRLASGLQSEAGGLHVHVRLIGTSVRSTKRWLEIDAEGVPYVVRTPRWRGPQLERGGEVVARRFGSDSALVAVGATDLDGVVAALAWASLGTMIRLPALPPMTDGTAGP